MKHPLGCLFIGMVLLFTLNVGAIPLFKITKDGKTSYLLGTAHNFPGEKLPFAIHQLINRSRLVLVESTAPSLDLMSLLKVESARDNKELFESIEWIKLKQLLKRVDLVSIERFRRLSPAGALAVFELAIAEREALRQQPHDTPESYPQLDSGKGIDRAIQDWARDAGVPLQALDLKELPTSTEAELVQFVKVYLKFHSAKSEGANDLYELYSRWTPSSEDNDFTFQSYARHHRGLVRAVNRHADWLPTLKKELSRGGVFAAVGLAHVLTFENMDYPSAPLLDQLADEGFEITFVNCESYLM